MCALSSRPPTRPPHKGCLLPRGAPPPISIVLGGGPLASLEAIYSPAPYGVYLYLMLVYMLINLIEERAYIGQTTLTLNDRLNMHDRQVKDLSLAPIHEAMRRWPEKDLWLAVVLQNCYDQFELDRCEEYWIERCHTAECGVGYNVQRSCHGTSEKQKHTATNMSEEQREKFREWGRKGAKQARINRALNTTRLPLQFTRVSKRPLRSSPTESYTPALRENQEHGTARSQPWHRYPHTRYAVLLACSK